MYTRLIQGYDAMDPESQATAASAASQLRLMVIACSHLVLEIFLEMVK